MLLEAGPRDINPWIHIPLGYSKLYANPRYNWMYESEPEPALCGRKLYQPRGKVLGGSSSINGMMYVRGNARDFDDWADSGCDGWSYRDVLPFFRKSEDQARGEDEWHGVGGPLKVSDQSFEHEIPNAFCLAAQQAGFKSNDDNGASQEGFGYYQMNTFRGRRWSTSRGYLTPVRRRANLHILTEAVARRIDVRNGRATGVVFLGAVRFVRSPSGKSSSPPEQ